MAWFSVFLSFLGFRRTEPSHPALPEPGPNYAEYVSISLAHGGTVGDALAAASGGSPSGAPKGEYDDLPVVSLQNWNIQKIRGALNSHTVGTFNESALLTESLLGDPRVQSATNGRIKAITMCEPVFESEDGEDEIREDLEALYPELLDEATLDQLLCWAIFMGFALAEVIWEFDDASGKVKPRLKVWHPIYVYYRIDIRRYVALTLQGQVVIEPGDPKWFLYTPWGAYRGWLRGAVRSVSVPWIVRSLALRDMARFSEKHGLPMVKLKVPAQSSASDKARLMAAARGLGADSVILLPQQGGADGQGFEADLLEAKDTSWKAFPGLIDVCERDILLAIRGTNLTSEVDGGSYAASQTHADEDSDYAESDRRKFASALVAQLFRPYVAFNYGDASLTPKFSYVAPATNQKDQGTTLKDLSVAVVALEGRGWPIDREVMAKNFGIPLLADVDPQQVPSTPPANDVVPEAS